MPYGKEACSELILRSILDLFLNWQTFIKHFLLLWKVDKVYAFFISMENSDFEVKDQDLHIFLS